MRQLIKKAVKKYLLFLILILLLDLAFSALNIYYSYTIGSFVDVLIESNSYDTINSFMKILIPISLAILFVYMFYKYLMGIMSIRMMGYINHKILEHMQKVPLAYYNNKDTTYIVQSINIDSYEISSFIYAKTTNFIKNIILIILLLVSIYRLNFIIFKIILVTIPLFCLIYLLLKKKLYKANDNFKVYRTRYIVQMFRQLENIKLIKMNSWFKELNNEFNEEIQDNEKSYRSVLKYEILFENTVDIVIKIVMIFFLIVGGKGILSGDLSVGMFIVLQSYILMLLNTLNSLSSYLASYQQMKTSYDRCADYMSLSIEHNGTDRVDSIEIVETNHLTFAYENENIIIEDITKEFNKGNIYCIYGKNGSGKSTYLNLLLGLYEDYDGVIRYSNIDIKELDLYKIRKEKIGVVEQEPSLMENTILSNITYGIDRKLDMEEIEVMAKSLDIHDFIHSLEKGYDTFVTEDKLSGGQKQKIALMRCLYKEPEILILDEPTSALDFKSIRMLIDFLQDIKEDKIIFVVTHHDEFLEIADEVIEFKRKDVAYEG